jgi:signal transduction histidine kinase
MVHPLYPKKNQMAALIEAYPWNSHPLGNPDQWPLSLKTSLSIMLNSAHPMFIWWTRDLYMFHNDPYLPALGDKHHRALGARASEMWPEIWGQIGNIVESILNGGEAFYAEELLIKMNRKGYTEETYWTFSYSSMPGDDGQVNGIFCVCNEVTETVLAKRRLKTARDIAESWIGLPGLEQVCQTSYKVLAQNPNDIPYSLIYLLSGPGMEAKLIGQLTELPPEISIALEKFIQSDKLPKCFAKVQKMGQEELFDISEYHRDGSGTGFPSQGVVLPLFQPENDQLLGFFVSGLSPILIYNEEYQSFLQLLARQIAISIASVKSRSEVDRQKSRLVNLFTQAPASICILDGPDLVYELVNPGYQQLFPGRNLLGKPILEVLPEIKNNEVYRTFKQVYETGITHEEQALLIPLARPLDGVMENRYFNYIQQARHNAQGHIDGVLVFAYEVTDLVLSRSKVEASEKRLKAISKELAARNLELGESNQQLRLINSDLDNFIYTASHDLKAPISNIEGLLQALLRSLPSETLKSERNERILHLMQGSIDRFKKTISNLTEITKLQKENSQEVTLVNISEVIEEVILDLEPLIQTTGARLEKGIQNNFPLHFSHKNLRSIIYNLLSNALKYHSPERNPLVQIHCQKTEDFVILIVQDNGLGMNLSDDSTIFGMFKRLHDHVEGAGIGLYMVKKILDNAGGRIEVESQEGKGSIFKVFFKL